MKIHELKIEGFKSIGAITLTEPNPFSVFVGPNASGKSNIFEALEFFELCNTTIGFEVLKLFGNFDDILNYESSLLPESSITFKANLGIIKPFLQLINRQGDKKKNLMRSKDFEIYSYDGELDENNLHYYYVNDKDFITFTNYSRLFIGESEEKVKKRNQDDSRLVSDASNLEKVLKRILRDEQNRGEIIEILQLLIPGFSNIEIRTEELSGSDNLVVYENALRKPLTRRLISDGTYNILALIAAIYQSNEPQFLCIEEPENGLNPKVVRQLVTLFRDKCREKGHYIWLNTHSQTLVSELTPDEIILVDKVDGLTQVKQIKGFDLNGLKMDEALLTNALGGGIPW